MSPSNAAKPPRPCTEYNIFFQLERAYILQVLLRAPPTLDASEAFRPSQASYAGLPPLPARYAHLVLPYDWHLPGKEKRRRRKHRRSHGAIGFHELSARIVDAWKAVDGDVKAYCGAVCAAGMKKYREAMKEWKRRQPAQPPKQDRPKAGAEAKPEKIKSGRDEVAVPNAASGDDDALQALLDELDFAGVAQDEAPLPIAAVSGALAVEEMDRAFENDPPFVWDEPVAPQAVPSANAVLRGQGPHVFKSRRTSVDMDDKEIFALWSNENTIGHLHGNDRRPDEKFDPKFNSAFGSGGYAQTLQDVQRMKEIMDLEAQIARLQRVKGRPRPRRRSVVACSA